MLFLVNRDKTVLACAYFKESLQNFCETTNIVDMCFIVKEPTCFTYREFKKVHPEYDIDYALATPLDDPF